ncbi:SAM-dependent methyltransferase [Sphingomonas aerolata]|uniref:SAM-dependent methyltransferase n=1 Tax=Sphingomonas aerolata TaxID=185951 RepID=UPI002FE11726
MRPDHSLDARYFDDVFTGDDDPWSLASSPYEAAKFDATIAAIDDRRYRSALEIGCAHGVLTARLAPLCDTLTSIDISLRAVELARSRCAALSNVTVTRYSFPAESPEGAFDLVVLSEVVYYWDDADIERAAAAIRASATPDCRIILVHWTGDTDYPQTGDAAVTKLRDRLGDFAVERAERTDAYRLDLWSLR